MGRLLVVLIVLVLLCGVAWAEATAPEPATVQWEQPELPAPAVADGERVVYQAPKPVPLMQVSLQAVEKQIIIPDEWVEFSVLLGTSFPEGVLAGAVSIKAAQTSTGRATFYGDLGLQLDSGKLSPILGGSIKIADLGDVKTRFGAGVRIPEFRLKQAEIILYSRALAW